MIKKITWGLYLFFAVWLFLGAIFVWVVLPETKNKTLEEMDMVFGSFTAQHDRDILSAIRSEVGLTQLLRGEASLGASEQKSAEEKGDSTGLVETV